jgi:ankyrin repeat protein
MLLQMGIGPNTKKSDGGTALHLAVSHDNYGVAQMLVNSGVGLNVQNDKGETALQLACLKKADWSFQICSIVFINTRVS